MVGDGNPSITALDGGRPALPPRDQAWYCLAGGVVLLAAVLLVSVVVAVGVGQALVTPAETARATSGPD